MLLQLEEDKIKAEKEDAARKEEERKENERKAEMLRQMQEDLETLKDAAPVETPEPDAVDTAPTLTTGEATLDKAATPLTTGAPAVDKAPAPFSPLGFCLLPPGIVFLLSACFTSSVSRKPSEVFKLLQCALSCQFCTGSVC